MQFLKDFFNHDKTIIGLSGIRKSKGYVKLTIPESYKKTLLTDTTQNYLLNF